MQAQKVRFTPIRQRVFLLLEQKVVSAYDLLKPLKKYEGNANLIASSRLSFLLEHHFIHRIESLTLHLIQLSEKCEHPDAVTDLR